jgi:hypothetical protein
MCALPRLYKLKVMVLQIKAMETAVQGGGSLELRFIDFPSTKGLLTIQGLCGGVTAARPSHRRRRVPEGPTCLFSLFWIFL